MLLANAAKANATAPLFERFSLNFSYFFRLWAITDIWIHLSACFSPIVFILRMPMNAKGVLTLLATVAIITFVQAVEEIEIYSAFRAPVKFALGTRSLNWKFANSFS